jgi:molybdate transport system substrate-binding protein
VKRRVALASVLALILAACSAGGPAAASPRSSAAAGTHLTIYAAASLKGVLDKVKGAYQAAVPGTGLTISTDSSAALETQIEQGAPADVFLSADQANAKKLSDAGLTNGGPRTFASNRLVIVVPSDNPAGISTPMDLARPGVEVIAAGDHVPISRYANQVVANLAREPGYPARFADAYAANVASKEDNVKALIAKVELGEGDAGIVYLTDAAASDRVNTIDIPDAANVSATYEGVVVKASVHATAARAFLDWFAGADGQAILRSFGFLPPSS